MGAKKVRCFLVLGRHAFKDLGCLCRCGHLEYVLLSEVLSLRVAAFPHMLRCCPHIVRCPAKLAPFRPKQQPVRAGTVSIGHPYTPCIEDAYTPYSPLKLHMGMSAHNYLLFNAGEDGVEPLLWSDGRKDLFVAAWGAVAEQDISQALNVEGDLFRQLGQKIPLGPP